MIKSIFRFSFVVLLLTVQLESVKRGRAGSIIANDPLAGQTDPYGPMPIKK